MITIDGITYKVPLVKFSRKAEFLDRYAQRTENGNLERDLIGVYINYQLTLGMSTDHAEYQKLWLKLTEPVEFHQVTVYESNGTSTFTAYFSGISDEMVRYKDGKSYFKGLQVSFIAKTPSRT